ETRCRLGIPGDPVRLNAVCPGTEDAVEEWRVKFAEDLADTLNLATKNARGIWKEYLYTQLEGGPRSPRSEHLVAEGRAGLPATTYASSGGPGTPSVVPPHREWYDWEWVGETEEARAKLGFEARIARIRRDSVMAPSTARRSNDVPEEAQRVVHLHAPPE